MIYKKIVYIFVSYLVLSSCSNREGSSKFDYSNGINELRVSVDFNISDDTSDSFYLGKIVDVKTDEQGTMFVADAMSHSIKQFTRDGTYLGKIGRRGRGEGELMDISGIYLEGEHLIVQDLVNRKIIHFSTGGEIVEELVGKLNPNFPTGTLIKIGSRQSTGYLSLQRKRADSKFYFHSYDNSFNQDGESFGRYIDLKLSGLDPFNQLTMINPGSRAISGINRLYFAPWVYSGYIYKFSYDSTKNRWIFNSALEGYISDNQSIEENSSPSDYQLSYRGNFYTGKLNYVSVGMFVKDKKLYHFTQMRNNNVPQFGLEIFDTNGDLLSYNIIKNKFYSPDTIPSFKVLHMDQKGNFYLLVEPTNTLYRFQLPAAL